jgi:hypothetical protein
VKDSNGGRGKEVYRLSKSGTGTTEIPGEYWGCPYTNSMIKSASKE